MSAPFEAIYWDCSRFGGEIRNGIARCTLALTERRYPLPSVYLLHPRQEGSPLHRALADRPGTPRLIDPPSSWRPGRRRWDQLLDAPGLLFAPGNAHRPCRWPSTVLVHDLICFSEAAYRRFRPMSETGYHRMLREAAAVLSISTFSAEQIRARFPGVAVKAVLRQGLFPEPSPAAPDPRPAQPFYLCLGGAEPRKALADAVALGNALDDAGLVLIGGDWGRRRPVARLLQSWRGRHPIHHLRSCDDAELAWLYRHCRALLFPSRHEGFGLPAFEALRAGRPVLARRQGPLPELLEGIAIWDDFAEHDAAQLAELRQRIDHWEPPAQLAERLAELSWDRARQRLDELFTELLRSC